MSDIHSYNFNDLYKIRLVFLIERKPHSGEYCQILLTQDQFTYVSLSLAESLKAYPLEIDSALLTPLGIPLTVSQERHTLHGLKEAYTPEEIINLIN